MRVKPLRAYAGAQVAGSGVKGDERGDGELRQMFLPCLVAPVGKKRAAKPWTMRWMPSISLWMSLIRPAEGHCRARYGANDCTNRGRLIPPIPRSLSANCCRDDIGGDSLMCVEAATCRRYDGAKTPKARRPCTGANQRGIRVDHGLRETGEIFCA